VSSLDVSAVATGDTTAAAPLVDSRRTPITDVAIRALDMSLAGALLVVLAPVLILIALAIRIDSPGFPIFRQRRVGRALKPFTVHKFRTMRTGATSDVHREFVLALIAGEQPEQEGHGPKFKLRSDARITRIGRFLRRTSLDELPQLWNVLRGEMSLVGPRPPIPYEVDHYPAHWFGRFAVKPGVTGLWQVSGRSELTLEEMIALDRRYVQERSFWLNVRILVRTIPVVLSTRGAT
jgi:lipopolysaccharide/colanic/teichoic acid biosynthesis glycosyltransferase